MTDNFLSGVYFLGRLFLSSPMSKASPLMFSIIVYITKTKTKQKNWVSFGFYGKILSYSFIYAEENRKEKKRTQLLN